MIVIYDAKLLFFFYTQITFRAKYIKKLRNRLRTLYFPCMLIVDDSHRQRTAYQ